MVESTWSRSYLVGAEIGKSEVTELALIDDERLALFATVDTLDQKVSMLV